MRRERPITSFRPQVDGEPGDHAGVQQCRFTIVIPAYNEAEFIGGCLESLSSQDFTGDYEIIVVDNNSTDDTAQIARQCGVTVVREDRPGVCAARQRGTLAAGGEIVVSTDADTRFDNSWLTRIDRAFSNEPSRVAVAGPCRYLDGPWWGRVYARFLFDLVHLVHRLTGKVMYVTATNIAFRKSAWSGYDTSATQGGDELDLLNQLQSRGPVTFDRGNPTFTSGRRLNQGLVYNIVVSCLFYYFLAHSLNRLAGSTVIGTAPAFRSAGRSVSRRTRHRPLLIGAACLAISVAAGALMTYFKGNQ